MAKDDKLTGVQKAAILFITLGPEASAGIIKITRLRNTKITYEIANITSVKSELKQDILEEFIQINKAKDYILEGGFEYAKIF